ncbi:MAG: hypothetical protein V3U08_00070 [Nitrospirales bacterium]
MSPPAVASLNLPNVEFLRRPILSTAGGTAKEDSDERADDGNLDTTAGPSGAGESAIEDGGTKQDS